MEASVIIPVFNKKELTLQCLEGLKKTLPAGAAEILVVDNASSDGSASAIKSWSVANSVHVKLIQNPMNLNFARANNQGALEAKGEFLICLNNDTIPLPGWFEALLQPLKEQPDVFMVGARLLYADKRVQHGGLLWVGNMPEHEGRNAAYEDPATKKSGCKPGVTAACMAMRKKDYLMFGGFDEAYVNGYEDVDLCLRVLTHGKKIWYAAEAELFHLEGQSPGRYSAGIDNWLILNRRWAGVIPNQGFPERELGNPLYLPEKSLISEKIALHGQPPRDASADEKRLLARAFAAVYTPELIRKLLPKLVDDEADAALFEGIALTKEGKIQEARRSFIDHLKRFPNDREAELRLAEIFLRENQPAKAVQILERIARKEPNNRSIADMLKKVRAISGDVEKPFVWLGAFVSENKFTSEKPVFSIVMLTHNQWHHTEKCLQSLEMYSDRPYELILVDNASTDGTAEKLRHYVQRHPNHKLILNHENTGFPRGNNLGFSIASGRFIIWLNNDTVVTPHWLSRIEKIFQENPDVGLVGPVTNQVVGPQLIAHVPYHDRETLESFSNERFSQFGTQTVELHRIIGFCLVHRKEVLDNIGGLDENFGRGNFEDDDFSVRARQAGFKIVMAPGIFIHHTGNQTFRAVSENYMTLINRNFTYFKEKWGISEANSEKGYRFDAITKNRHGEHVQLPVLLKSHQKTSDKIFVQQMGQTI
jgi:GT2 family glycosyltransferase